MPLRVATVWLEPVLPAVASGVVLVAQAVEPVAAEGLTIPVLVAVSGILTAIGLSVRVQGALDKKFKDLESKLEAARDRQDQKFDDLRETVQGMKVDHVAEAARKVDVDRLWEQFRKIDRRLARIEGHAPTSGLVRTLDDDETGGWPGV